MVVVVVGAAHGAREGGLGRGLSRTLSCVAFAALEMAFLETAVAIVPVVSVNASRVYG